MLNFLFADNRLETVIETLRSLSDRFFQEFPRIDDRIVSRQHRYGYTTAFKQLQNHMVAPVTEMGHTSGNVLLKHDIKSGLVEEHRFEQGAAGEGVFVPVSLGAGEDEGYVMAFAHDLDGGNTGLVILAAQDFAGEPLARIHLSCTLCGVSSAVWRCSCSCFWRFSGGLSENKPATQ
jgi:carotenoid cleavage dioxygenase